MAETKRKNGMEKPSRNKKKDGPRKKRTDKPPVPDPIGKYRRIPGTKLNEWEHRYVLGYCADPTKTNMQLLTEMGYPCEPKYYPNKGSAMWRKPAVQEAIQERMQDVLKRLDIDTFKVLKRLKDIAFTDVAEAVSHENNTTKVKNFSDITPGARAIIAGIDQTPSEYGMATRVRLRDPIPVLERFLKILGMENPARHSAAEPHKLQKEAVKAVRSKEKSVMDACLDLEAEGVPIPQTLLIMLNKQAGEIVEDEGPVVVPTPDEQAALAKSRLQEIEEQRKQFLPERQAEIRKLKEELKASGKGNSFDPDVIQEEKGEKIE